VAMKIVVGVDGSDPACRALEWCVAHANALEGDVVVVHAIDLPIVVAPLTTYIPMQSFSEVDHEAVEELVQSWCKPLTDAAIPFRVELKQGDAAFAIMEVANAEDADLVITGRRGRGGFAELLLGGTSYALTHHLNRPLLIIP
jgi:nucleotide-binding universal stress UspA family protein